MGQTAIISPQILDSTTIGRDLITAATAAAAHAALDLEDTAFSYALTQTFEAGLVTGAITSAANIVTTMPSSGQGQYYFGANPIYLMNATVFRPAEAGTSVALGSDTRRWTNVYSVDGDFSGTVTVSNGTKTASFSEVGSAAGYVRAAFLLGDTTVNNVAMWVAPEGTAQKPSTIEALTNSDTTLTATKRIGIRADISENVIYSGYGNGTAANTPLRIKPNGLNGDWSLSFYQDNASFNCDVSVDGNLTSEVGGSYKLYNLGDESATDSEYFSTSYGTKTGGSSPVVKLESLSTGAGVTRGIEVMAGATSMFLFDSVTTTNISNRDLVPSPSGSRSLGTSSFRWANVYAVDGTFSGDITAVSVIGTGNLKIQNSTDTANISLGGSGAVTITASGSIYQQFVPTGVSYRKPCHPTFDGSVNLGLETLRWGKTWSVDGSFSGNLNTEVGGSQRLYNLGNEGDTDTEYLDMYWDNNNANISVKATGSGTTVRPFNLRTDSTFAVKTVGGTNRFSVSTSRVIASLDLIPSGDNTRQCGRVGARWSKVNSVDGDFSGTVTTDAIDSTGSLIVSNNGTQKLEITSSRIRPSVNFFPLNDDFVVCGQEGSRWKSVASVDGSFTGSLTSEVGGSMRLYNLGDESATDSEYYETSWDGNNLKMYAKATGAGVVRSIQFGSSSVQIDAKDATDQIVFRTGGTYRMQINNAAVVSTVDIQPSANGTLSNGHAALRWSGVYGVDGDFSGSLTTGGLKTAIGGTLSTSITLTTSDHTILCDCQLNNISVNLPTAVGNDGQVFVIKKVDATANFITVFASGAETIDGGSLHIINTQNESIHVQAYSGDWYII